MTAAALAFDPEPVCEPCVAHDGLCHSHAPHVLPQLARPGWVRLIGEQSTKKASARSVPAQKAMRRTARRLERLQRATRGVFIRNRRTV